MSVVSDANKKYFEYQEHITQIYDDNLQYLNTIGVSPELAHFLADLVERITRLEDGH